MSALQRYATGLCYAAMMCVAVAVNLQPVLLTTLGLEFGGRTGLTNEQLGAIGAATFVGLSIGILLTGPLADRLGARPFVVGGHALVAAGLALLGLAPAYSAVLAAVFVMGLGAGVLDMILSPIVAALDPHRRTSAMNWLHSFYCTGAVATILIGSAALKLAVGWRWVALGMMIPPAVVGLAFTRMPLPRLVPESGAGRTRLRTLCREPFYLAALCAIFLAGATELGMAQWLPAYAETGLGFSKWIGGMALLVFSMAMGAGRIATGLAAHRLDSRRLMLGCSVAAAALYALGALLPWPAAALAACAFMGLAVSCLWPCTLGFVSDRYPNGGASLFGLLGAAGNSGGVFMPWLVGAIADRGGIRLGILSAVIAPILLVVLLVWMGRESNRVRRP